MQDILTMLRDYMEKGFLENIIDMFRQDPSLWAHVPEMITDERSRVRIGTVALVETMASSQPDHALRALPDIALKLSHPEPTIRGDVVFLLSGMGIPEVLLYLEHALEAEDNEAVRKEIGETIEELKAGN